MRVAVAGWLVVGLWAMVTREAVVMMVAGLEMVGVV